MTSYNTIIKNSNTIIKFSKKIKKENHTVRGDINFKHCGIIRISITPKIQVKEGMFIVDIMKNEFFPKHLAVIEIYLREGSPNTT